MEEVEVYIHPAFKSEFRGVLIFNFLFLMLMKRFNLVIY